MNKLDMMDQEHIVMDLETVDLLPTAGILSIGAVRFTPRRIIEEGKVEEEFYINVNVESCIKLGMTFSWDTLYWWFKQDKEAGEALQKNKKHILSALRKLNDFIYNNKVRHIWSNPNKFDISILENAYNLGTILYPWEHKEVRDLVTLEGIIGDVNKEVIKKSIPLDFSLCGVKHNALYDSYVEAYRISHALNSLSCQI